MHNLRSHLKMAPQQSEVVTKENIHLLNQKNTQQMIHPQESKSENGIDQSKMVSEYDTNTNHQSIQGTKSNLPPKAKKRKLVRSRPPKVV